MLLLFKVHRVASFLSIGGSLYCCSKAKEGNGKAKEPIKIALAIISFPNFPARGNFDFNLKELTVFLILNPLIDEIKQNSVKTNG